MTYNQEKFIRQCLQSIVDQKTDFHFEVIVGDDCSTDGTRDILREFAKNYPNIVKLVLHTENVGVGINYRSVHDAAVGEYVAHCDGDDAWLPEKLTYQTNLMDKNPQASQCWGCANLIDDAGKKVGIFPSRLARLFNPKLITAKDIALSYALVGQHSTQMYRRKFKFDFDVTKPVLDFWIAFNISINGPSIYSKKIVSCYRVTTSPSMTRSTSKKRATVDYLALHLAEIINKYPAFSREAKANMVMRRFVSKIKGHSLEEIDKQIEAARETPLSIWCAFKSIVFFGLQKFY